MADYHKTFKMPGQHEYDGMTFPGAMAPLALDRIKSFDFKDDDIIVESFPKAGTTWLKEIMYLIVHNADTAKAKSANTMERGPFLEMKIGNDEGYEFVKNIPGPRVLTTHVPASYIERQVRNTKARVVYIYRNPKDSLVSAYNMYKIVPPLGFYEGSWDSFFNMYKAGKMFYNDWFDHINDFWQLRNLPNVKILSYEDLKLDLPGGVRELAKFCDVTLTDEQVYTIVDHCSFKSMKENKTVNAVAGSEKKGDFIRKGEVGDWTNYFNDEQNEYIATMYDAKVKDIGLSIRYK